METNAYDLFKSIHESKGMVYLGRKKGLSFSYNIFFSNFHELKKACAFVENPENGVKLLLSESLQSRGVAAHMEVNRLFHNFLAGAQTLVEHTRNFMREYYFSTSVKNAYDHKISIEFSNDGLSKFIQDLRNYIVHKGLPKNSITLSATRQSLDMQGCDLVTSVTLSKKDLLLWKQWSKNGRAYIETLEDQIVVSSIANPYGDKIISLHDWLNKKLDEHHSGDLKKLNELQKAYSLADEQRGKVHS